MHAEKTGAQPAIGSVTARPVAGLLLLAMFGWVEPAWAHPGRPVAPHDLWGAWAEDPWSLLLVGVAAWAYARGTGRLWRRAGAGRGIPHWRFYSYCGGLAALFLALISPLEALGGSLFSAHMVQHEVLILVAAPLLVLGQPMLAWLWALPPAWRRRVGGWGRRAPVRTSWRLISHPLSAWLLHAAAVWIWHTPRLYQATLVSEAAHALQHASFFGTALLFWWTLLHPDRHRRLAYGMGVLYLFTTAVYGSALGALLTFATRPWYPAYAERAAAWGFTALEDQQLGGLIMWIPFGTVYTAAALALFARLVLTLDRRGAAATHHVPELPGRQAQGAWMPK